MNIFFFSVNVALTHVNVCMYYTLSKLIRSSNVFCIAKAPKTGLIKIGMQTTARLKDICGQIADKHIYFPKIFT